MARSSGFFYSLTQIKSVPSSREAAASCLARLVGEEWEKQPHVKTPKSHCSCTCLRFGSFLEFTLLHLFYMPLCDLQHGKMIVLVSFVQLWHHFLQRSFTGLFIPGFREALFKRFLFGPTTSSFSSLIPTFQELSAVTNFSLAHLKNLDTVMWSSWDLLYKIYRLFYSLNRYLLCMYHLPIRVKGSELGEVLQTDWDLALLKFTLVFIDKKYIYNK